MGYPKGTQNSKLFKSSSFHSHVVYCDKRNGIITINITDDMIRIGYGLLHPGNGLQLRLDSEIELLLSVDLDDHLVVSIMFVLATYP